MTTNQQPDIEQSLESHDAVPMSDQPAHHDNYDLRLQRIADYQSQALAKKHHLKSNLASINCGLMRIATQLETTIEQAMARSEISEAGMERLDQAIGTHLRVTRQIDRFAQIDLRPSVRGKPRLKKVEISEQTGEMPASFNGQSEDLKT
jgi:hypothetical protein